MIEHIKTIAKYEAYDGKIFKDEDKCMRYELKKLYKESGIRFINATRPLKNLNPDTTYDTARYITIDRTKEEENKRFVDYANDMFGWCLLKDLDLEYGLGTKYRMEFDELVEIK